MRNENERWRQRDYMIVTESHFTPVTESSVVEPRKFCLPFDESNIQFWGDNTYETIQFKINESLFFDIKKACRRRKHLKNSF